jgi:hypothetical protein
MALPVNNAKIGVPAAVMVGKVVVPACEPLRPLRAAPLAGRHRSRDDLVKLDVAVLAYPLGQEPSPGPQHPGDLLSAGVDGVAADHQIERARPAPKARVVQLIDARTELRGRHGSQARMARRAKDDRSVDSLNGPVQVLPPSLLQA